MSGTARRDGIPFGCAEEAAAGSLRTQLRREPGQRGLTLELVAFGSELGGGTSPLRTRCPGPAAGSGSGTSLAAGRLPLAEVLQRALTVRLSARGAEVAAGYAVTRRKGEIVLRLRRRSASVATTRRVRSR